MSWKNILKAKGIGPRPRKEKARKPIRGSTIQGGSYQAAIDKLTKEFASGRINFAEYIERKEQIMAHFNVGKAPPIENPRRSGDRYPNDDLSDAEYEKLFEKHIDPAISQVNPSEDIVKVYADGLKMSKEKAVEKLRQFYTEDMGYKITPGRYLDIINIHFLE